MSYYYGSYWWTNSSDTDPWGNSTTNDYDFDVQLVPLEDVSVEAVITSFYINSVVFVLLMIVYECLRRILPHVYSSRKRLLAYVRSSEGDNEETDDSDRNLGERAKSSDSTDFPDSGTTDDPLSDDFGKVQYSNSLHSTDVDDLSTTSPLPPLADLLFRQDKNSERRSKKSMPLDWVQPVFGVPWNHIRKVAGLDGYFFLRFIRMNVRITAVSTFWFFLLLVPAYVTGSNNAKGWYHMSAANVATSDSWRMWMPILFMYLLSAFTIFVIKQEYRHFLELRQDFLARGLAHVSPQNRYSIMIENIPWELRSDRALKDYFEQLFPGKVHSACVVLKLSDLEDQSRRCMRTCRRLEKSIAYLQATDKRPSHRAGQGRVTLMGLDMTPIQVDPLCCAPHPDPLVVTMENSLRDSVARDAVTESAKNKLVPRGTLVDSISYYTLELAEQSRKLREWQRKAEELSESGNQRREEASDWISKAMAGAESISNQIMKDSILENSLLTPVDSYHAYGSVNAEHMTSQYGTIGPFSDKRVALLDADDLLELEELSNRSSNSSPVDAPFNRSVYGTQLRRFAGRMGLDFLVAGTKIMNKQVDIAAEGILGSTMSSTGFVTFLDLTSTTCAVSAPLTVKPGALKTQVAPEPREMNWQNIHIAKTTITRREIFVNMILTFGIFLWSFPLAAIQAFAKAEYLAQLPGMDWILTFHGGEMTSFVNGYLPVVALLGLILILPLIFEQVAVRYERRKTFIDVQASMLSRYFYYQLANVYVSVTAGSILKSLADILDHPQNILALLGDSLPTMVGYFVALLVTKIMAGLPMVFLRFGALSRMLILRLLASEKQTTQRELDWVYRLENVQYGWEFPTQLLVVVIVFVFAAICPIILPFGFLYFTGALIVYKKQLLYVYSPVFESGGALFPIAIQRVMFGLVCGQMTLLGYTVTRKCYYEPVALLPLPLITIWVTRYFHHNFAVPSQRLSLERARHYDRSLYVRSNSKKNRDPLDPSHDRTEANLRARESSFDKNAYKQPVLTEVPALPWMYRRGFDDHETSKVRRQLKQINLSTRHLYQEFEDDSSGSLPEVQ